MKKKVITFFIVCILVLAFFSIITVLFDLWNEFTSNIISTCILLLFFSIPFLCCYTIYKKPNKKYISMVGMIVCCICCTYVILVNWNLISFPLFDRTSWALAIESILLPISFGHISLLLFLELKTKVARWIRIYTIAISALFDFSVFSFFLFSFFANGKYFLILIILIVVGTVLIPIFNKLGSISTIDGQVQLKKLKELYEQQIITVEEYEIAKSRLLKGKEEGDVHESGSGTN